MIAVSAAGAASVMSSQSMSIELAHHQAGDEEQRRRGGEGRDRAGERREEQREQEQHADGQRGQAGAAAGLHARGALDVGGGGGGAEQRAGDDRRAVGEQRLAELRVGVARALGQQAGALGDADQRAGGVEHLDQHEDQDDLEDADAERAEDVELQEGRRDRRRRST